MLLKVMKKNFIFLDESNYNETKLEKNKNYYLDGYWQNLQYFDNSKSIILEKIRFNINLSSRNENILNILKKTESVAIHVRRGDYLKSSHWDPVSADYYHQSIIFLKNKTAVNTFIFFSDDIKWTRKKFNYDNSIFVNWNQGKAAQIDLYLMTQAKHNIIANSSF